MSDSRLQEMIGDTPFIASLFEAVAEMLRDGLDWQEIGRAIGWPPGKAEQFFVMATEGVI